MNNSPPPAPETAERTLGQIAYEARWPGDLGWPDMPQWDQNDWERVGNAVRLALTPPAIAPGDVAIAPEAEVAKLGGELEEARKYMEQAGYVLRQREAMVDGLTKKLVSILGAVQPEPFIANGCKYEFDPPEDILREHWKALSTAIRAALAQEPPCQG